MQTKKTKTAKQTILVVDDASENIEMLVGILGGTYKVKAALSGEEGLEIALKKPPELILLDIMMPGMDGFETCQKLKESPSTSSIPIVFLTAKIEADNIVKAFEIGAVDYVTKPFNAAELLSRVNTHLQLQKAKQEVDRKNEQLETLANKLSKYLSPQIYDSIFTGEKDVKIETARKKLTVFFSDIVGFTPKSEEMEHQELTQWLNNYLNEMSLIALKYEGTLDKFIGDAIMIFFGDPKTLGEKEDAMQCVKMALEMTAKAKELGVEIRVGINSGECTVGNFGSDDRMEYTIIGKAVNLAARLEQNSEPGKILTSEFTHQLIHDEIPCEERGNIHVKGIDHEVKTFWAKG